jgi:hypothetical protein
MPVLVTAVKNRPSKRGSRLKRACSQTRESGTPCGLDRWRRRWVCPLAMLRR